jgi:four helix bundle protein
MSNFLNLEIYKLTKAFYLESRALLKDTRADYFIKSQFQRAAHSVNLNLVEGTSRITWPSRRNFYIIARGSVLECMTILDLLKEEGFITIQQFQYHFNKADQISRILYAMINKKGVTKNGA